LALQGFCYRTVKYVDMPPCLTCEKAQLYRQEESYYLTVLVWKTGGTPHLRFRRHHSGQ